ncbi:MAG: ABC transporter permease [Novosphingobium sp.]|nr:ABC transporter permease [Novosphingobium sp.]
MTSGRLSTLAAAMVIARRDFGAILFSRSFFFFLLGPLFPVIIGAMAGGVGQHVQQSTERPELGIAMQGEQVDAMLAAHQTMSGQLGNVLPKLVVIERLEPNQSFDAKAELAARKGNIAAVFSGTLSRPVMTGTVGQIEQWRGPMSMLAARALSDSPKSYPEVALVSTAASTAASERRGQLLTAQAAQTLLFLLTMLLAGMVLSNLVEEKANKIIEILAAAIPMDAVFFGKLFAMLAISLVGIAVWGLTFGGVLLAAGSIGFGLTAPAVGWPIFVALGIVYFAMAYLLLGSVFLSIGSMATTVREVQTISMPVTMMQLMVFFLASYAMTQPGSPVEMVAVAFPFSSPFAMMARAAQDGTLWTHAAALAWQGLCVVIFVRTGARLSRTRVMKSGPAHDKGTKRSLFSRLRPA